MARQLDPSISLDHIVLAMIRHVAWWLPSWLFPMAVRWVLGVFVILVGCRLAAYALATIHKCLLGQGGS